MVIVDTNIIIDHLRTTTDYKSKLVRLVQELPQEVLSLSVISIQELYEGQSTKVESKEKDLLATIGSLKILPYDYDTAELAGKIARDLSRPIQLADVAIAATAVIHGASLFTLNTKDFIAIEGLDLYELREN